MINLSVDGNGYLGLSMTGIIEVGGSYYLNSAGDGISARVSITGGNVWITESKWGNEDKLATTKMNVYVVI